MERIAIELAKKSLERIKEWLLADGDNSLEKQNEWYNVRNFINQVALENNMDDLAYIHYLVILETPDSREPVIMKETAKLNEAIQAAKDQYGKMTPDVHSYIVLREFWEAGERSPLIDVKPDGTVKSMINRMLKEKRWPNAVSDNQK